MNKKTEEEIIADIKKQFIELNEIADLNIFNLSSQNEMVDKSIENTIVDNNNLVKSYSLYMSMSSYVYWIKNMFYYYYYKFYALNKTENNSENKTEIKIENKISDPLDELVYLSKNLNNKSKIINGQLCNNKMEILSKNLDSNNNIIKKIKIH